METLRFEIVSGVNKGYHHSNCKESIVEFVANLWQDIAKREFQDSAIYVSAVIKSSKTVYHKKWGCPRGGEETVVITGVANKEFVHDIELWKKTVIKLANELKNELGQSTLTCEFINTELHYFK